MDNPFDELRNVDDDYEQIWHEAYKTGLQLVEKFDPVAIRVVKSYGDFLGDECFPSHSGFDFPFFYELTKGSGFIGIYYWRLISPKSQLLSIGLGCLKPIGSKTPENYRIDLGVRVRKGFIGHMTNSTIPEDSGVAPDKFIEQIEDYEKKLVDTIKDVYRRTQPWDN